MLLCIKVINKIINKTCSIVKNSYDKPAGKYNTNITGSSNNYDINVTQGELEITKANLTVIADDKTKYKGEDNPNLTYVANGLLGEDTLTGDLETTADKNSNVGDLRILCTFLF